MVHHWAIWRSNMQNVQAILVTYRTPGKRPVTGPLQVVKFSVLSKPTSEKLLRDPICSYEPAPQWRLVPYCDRSSISNFEIIDGKTFRLGNECMVAAVRQLHDGKAERVPQWTEGKLFLRRTGYVYDPFLHVK